MRAVDATQLAECVSSMKGILDLILSSIKSGMAAHIYNPNTQVVEARVHSFTQEVEEGQSQVKCHSLASAT